MEPLTISYWPATTDAELVSITCGDALREAAASAPDHVALIAGTPDPGPHARWSYAELLRASEAVAANLLSRYPPGAHIALWAANCPEWIFAQFGIALAGMVMVTVNPASTERELAHIVRQSRSRAVIHADSYRGCNMGDVLKGLIASGTLSADIIRIDDITRAPGVPVVGWPGIDPASPAMIQYTSGTTGLPKGVLLSHYNVTNTSRIMARIKEQTASTIALTVAPLFHTGGCVAGVLATVQTRGTILLMEAFSAELMLDLIERERATFTFAVPTMLIALLRAQEERPRDLSSLRMIFSGGAIVPIEVVRQVEVRFGVKLIIGYGLTETSPAITHTRPGDSAADKSETIGRAIPLVEVKIVDPLTGTIQPIGMPGELCARGFNVMLGYYDLPEATAAAIDPDGWLHTGDLCAMDERGYCRVTGRLKEVIIRGGENIYPREVEDVLLALPDISEIAVFGVPDGYWGEQVAGAVRLNDPAGATGEFLTELASRHLPRHKVPRFWFHLESFPMTSSGKIQKARLTEMYKSGELGSFLI